MAVNRSSNASELRLILSRLKEVQEKLERSDQSSLASKLSDINGSLSIIKGNPADFLDTVLQTLDQMQTATQVSPPSSARKRKIARHRGF